MLEYLQTQYFFSNLTLNEPIITLRYIPSLQNILLLVGKEDFICFRFYHLVCFRPLTFLQKLCDAS